MDVEIIPVLNDNHDGGEGTRKFEFYEGVDAETEDGACWFSVKVSSAVPVSTTSGIGATAPQKLLSGTANWMDRRDRVSLYYIYQDFYILQREGIKVAGIHSVVMVVFDDVCSVGMMTGLISNVLVRGYN